MGMKLLLIITILLSIGCGKGAGPILLPSTPPAKLIEFIGWDDAMCTEYEDADTKYVCEIIDISILNELSEIWDVYISPQGAQTDTKLRQQPTIPGEFAGYYYKTTIFYTFNSDGTGEIKHYYSYNQTWWGEDYTWKLTPEGVKVEFIDINGNPAGSNILEVR